MRFASDLNHIVYGLKSAGRLWNGTIDKWFKKMGYKQLPMTHAYTTIKDSNRFIYVALYVDDCSYAGDDEYMRDFEHAITVVQNSRSGC